MSANENVSPRIIKSIRPWVLSLALTLLPLGVVGGIPLKTLAQTLAVPKGLKPAKPARKATLSETYAMFFKYAVHVDARTATDSKKALDRSFYQRHLQKESALGEIEYASVLASAKQFVLADAAARTQAAVTRHPKTVQLNGKVPSSNEVRENSNRLKLQLRSALDAGVQQVRAALGSDRTTQFESYLQNSYLSPKLPTQTVKSTIQSGVLPNSETVSAQVEGVPVNGPSDCQDFYDSDGDGITVCADAQMSYLGPNGLVELYAEMDADWDDDVDVDDYSVEGDLFINDSQTQYSCFDSNPNSDCEIDLTLASGNGVSYAWYPTGEVDFYDDCGDDPCVASFTSDPAVVTITYPDINTISPQQVPVGNNGSFLIDGEGLISPFQNPPTVTVSDQDGIFDSFSVQSFSEENGTITVAYKTQQDADTGEQLVTVNNGFGPGDVSIFIDPPNPAISSITISGSAQNIFQAGGATQSVVLTGTGFGTSAPNIMIGSGGSGVSIVNGSISAPSQNSPPQQSVVFQASVAPTAPAGTVSFELHANDAATDPNAYSPAVSIAPDVAPAPTIILGIDPSQCGVAANVAGTTQSILIGQRVAFIACVPAGVTILTGSGSWSPNEPPSAIALAGWNKDSVNGQISVNLPAVSATVCSTAVSYCAYNIFYFTGPTNPQGMTFSYTYTASAASGGGVGTASVTYVASGPNGITVTPSTGSQVLYNSGSLQLLGRGQGTLSNLGVSATPTDQGNVAGTYSWVQIINSRDVSVLSNTGSETGSPSVDGPALDSSYPYVVSLNFNDSPDIEIYTMYGEEFDQFIATVYLMWTPASDPNCTTSDCVINVPVGSFQWGYVDEAINTLNAANNSPTSSLSGWVLSTGCTAASANQFVPSSGTAAYPNWDKTVTE